MVQNNQEFRQVTTKSTFIGRQRSPRSAPPPTLTPAMPEKTTITHLASASAPACLAAPPLKPGRFGAEDEDVGLVLMATAMSSCVRIAFCWISNIDASAASLSCRKDWFSFCSFHGRGWRWVGKGAMHGRGVNCRPCVVWSLTPHILQAGIAEGRERTWGSHVCEYAAARGSMNRRERRGVVGGMCGDPRLDIWHGTLM